MTHTINSRNAYPGKPAQHGSPCPTGHGSGLALLCALLLLAALTLPAVAEAPSSDPFAAALELLNQSSFVKKAEAVKAIERLDHPQGLPVLRALLNGDLHARAEDGRFFIVRDKGGELELIDALSGEVTVTATKDGLKKVIINNQLRLALRAAVARLSLSNEDPAVRLSAVEEIMNDLDEAALGVLRAALAREADGGVREGMENALALGDLESPQRKVRQAAVTKLGASLSSVVRNRLTRLMDDPSEDPAVRAAARRSVSAMRFRLQIYGFFETVFFGLSLGAVLVLASIGLAITFGVMGVINMAHGELMMLGAYTTYVVQQWMPGHLDVSLFVAIPLAFLVSGLAGIAIERGVIRFLYGRPLETLLATFGISLVLQQAVRTIFSPLNRSVSTPAWMSGSLEINNALTLTYNRLYITAFGLLVFAGLVMLLKRTRLGLEVRAVAQNRSMAKAMGIRTEWVDAMTFGLGSGIAGIAGVALSQLTNVGPNLGQSYIVDCFMVVVFGGVGNLWGTLVGGLSLGIVNKFLEPSAGAVLAKILVLVFIIVYIQKRPRGLFPQKGRAAES
ncbi:MAG: urea ABC transporter permease subunit UrtB [Gammaproteobacteria bacterium]|nr:urea ABC transporter permease subunit UrtB [Gammaproteobacteria bacterium]